MNRLSKEEKQVLDQLVKDNFYSVSKGNVRSVTTILNKLDPKVAIALIEQMPESIKGMVEIQELYTSILSKSIDSCSDSEASCFATEDKIVDAMIQELGKDIPFDQKKYYVGHMVDSAMRKEEKDSEHRETVLTVVKCGFLALGAGLLFLGSMFFGGSDDD